MKGIQFTYVQTFSTEFVLIYVGLHMVALTSLVFLISNRHYSLSINFPSFSPSLLLLRHKFPSFI